MAVRDTKISGAYLAPALVSPTGGGADVSLADVAQAAMADGGGAVASLDDVGDVTYTGTPSDAQALVWSAGAWRNSTIAAAEGSGTAVDTISAMQSIAAPADKQLVTVRGYYVPADGGGGTFMWNAASTTDANGGTVIAAAGGGTGRWLRLYDQSVSMKAFGAKGDDLTDDTAAIQAAINSGLPIFVPHGTYRITSSIIIPPRMILIGGKSSATFRDVRTGGPEEPMFHRMGRWMQADGTYVDAVPGGYSTGVLDGITLINLSFIAAGVNGHCVDIQGQRRVYIEKCFFQAALRGLSITSECFDNTVIACRFDGRYLASIGWDDMAHAEKAWGLYVGGHAFCYGISAQGCGVGLRIIGTGVVVSGVRAEENIWGMMIGGTAASLYAPWSYAIVSGSSISGCRLEANKYGLVIKEARNSVISGLNMQGSPATLYDGVPNRPDSESGLVVEKLGLDCRVENIEAGGNFTRAGMINFTHVPIWFSNVANGVTSAAMYGSVTKPLSLSSNHFLKTMMHANAAKNQRMTSFSDLMLRGLTGINIHNPGDQGPAISKNLGGVATPASGASSANVTFFVELVTNTYSFGTLTLQNDGTSLLEPGTYYYGTSIVAPHGESSVPYNNTNTHMHQTITVGAGQKVYITFNGGTPSGTVRRLYRGTTAGFFGRYWDFTATNFTDDGKTAFTARGMPPDSGNVLGRVEDDTAYHIVATPSWATTVHVTNKATTGFTLNFGTAAPDANQTVAWLLFRP
jgi:hypothetical protein